jgi:RNA exonuclease 4
MTLSSVVPRLSFNLLFLKVVDARATMAIFRIHKKEWEKGVKPIEISTTSKKRKGKDRVPDGDDDQVENADTNSGLILKNRKGVSSGISTVVKRRGSDSTMITKMIKGKSSSGGKKAWWSELPKSGSKGSIQLRR